MDLWGHDHRSINPYRMPLVFNSFSFEMFWFWTYFPHVRHKCVYYLTTKTKITDSSFFFFLPLLPPQTRQNFGHVFVPARGAPPVLSGSQFTSKTLSQSVKTRCSASCFKSLPILFFFLSAALVQQWLYRVRIHPDFLSVCADRFFKSRSSVQLGVTLESLY